MDWFPWRKTPSEAESHNDPLEADIRDLEARLDAIRDEWELHTTTLVVNDYSHGPHDISGDDSNDH